MSEDLYAILGVPKDADQTTIKKAYRKLSLTHHPDKGGDTDTFHKLNRAHEILSDENKRKLYDLGGFDAVERGHAGGDDEGMDIFDLFGGGRRGGGRRQPSGPRKGDPVHFPLDLTLEEMYTGCVKKLRLTRSVECSDCQGKGGKGITTCTPCQGRGVRVVVQRLGPGMISQSQTTCDACRGQGTVIAPGQECNTCAGQKIIKEKNQLDVTVPRGGRAGQTSVFVGQGDQLPGQLAGDIIVEFKGKPHDRFERKGHHLHSRHKITLLEALTGFTLYIPHLDGHEVKIECKDVLQPGAVICVPDEGFTHSFGNGHGIETGNLYVHFDIEFPTTAQIAGKGDLTNAKKVLSTILPTNSSLKKNPTPKGQVVTPVFKITDVASETRRHEAEEREWKRHEQQQERQQAQSGSHYDDDDGHHGHGGMQPGCAPM